MDKYQETFNTWNNIASLYEEKFMEMDIYNPSYDIFCKAVTKEKAKILDIGSGPGNITRYLLSQRPDYDIFGIDIAQNMIDLARKNNPTAKFAVMDTRDIGQLKEKFDGIICGFCLPYLSPEERNTLISSAHNLLNENGLVYLSFVEGDPEKSDFKTGGGGRVFFHFHLLDDIKYQLIQSKFIDIETIKVEYTNAETHTILIARKSIIE